MTASMTVSNPYNVKTAIISLYKGDNRVKNIIEFASSITGEFSYRWVVDVQQGTDYRFNFYVVYNDDSTISENSQIFSVTSNLGTDTPQITILEPENNIGNIVLGDNVPFRWRVISESSVTYNSVSLFQSGNERELERITTRRHGGVSVESWRVNQRPGSGYYLKFFAENQAGGIAQADSQTFTIEEGINTDLLNIGGHFFGDPDSNGLSTQTAGFGVNSVSGNFYHEETDISMPGIGLPFAFTRSYNSMDIGIDQFINPMPLPLGDGWTHAYNIPWQLRHTKNQL